MGTGASPTRIGGGSSKPTIAAASGRVDSHAVTKRLQSELMALMSGGDPGVSAFPDGESLFAWAGTIHGAAGTVYEGLSYKLSLKFPTGEGCQPYKSPPVVHRRSPSLTVAGAACWVCMLATRLYILRI